MVHKAAGGGLVMAFTTLIKFGLYALALSAFWGGFLGGCELCGELCAGAVAAFHGGHQAAGHDRPGHGGQAQGTGSGDAIESFVDEDHPPGALAGGRRAGQRAGGDACGAGHCTAHAPHPGHTAHQHEKQALHVLESLHLLGPSLLFAAFTGVLLFASSIIAGWTENWFVLHRLDSAMRYNPRITRLLGTARAARWAHFLRENISGFAANISLGFMLGLVPAIATFFGLGLDVRHVTCRRARLALPAPRWAGGIAPEASGGQCHVALAGRPQRGCELLPGLQSGMRAAQRERPVRSAPLTARASMQQSGTACSRRR
jgi:hypothetical protein